MEETYQELYLSPPEMGFLNLYAYSTHTSQSDVIRMVIYRYCELAQRLEDENDIEAQMAAPFIVPSVEPITDLNFKNAWKGGDFITGKAGQFCLTAAEVEPFMEAWQKLGGNDDFDEAFRTAFYACAVDSV